MKSGACFAGPFLVLAGFTALVGESLAVGPLQSTPARTTSETARIDALFERWDRGGSPGCAIAVVHNGVIVQRGGYGLAHLEHAVPIVPETVFDVGSLSKQFTAAAVALLAERGVLSLDDEVRRWVPELPEYEAAITLRHLIHHTSGIRDYFTLWSLMGRDIDDAMPVDEVLALIVRQRELNFVSGTDHDYSNSNYFLLARVVERATGRSLREVAREEIFGPLAMDDTDYYDDVTELRPGRAESYAERDGGFGRRVLRSTIVGDGGVYTTVDDLALWAANFDDNRLGVGGPELVEVLLTPARLLNGERRPYAFGVRRDVYRGLDTVSHGGTMAGYRSFMVRFPRERFSSIVLCNQLEISPYQLSHRIADVYLEDRMTARPEPVPEPFLRAAPSEEPPVGPELSEAELRALAGRYRSDEIETTYEIVARAGRLVLLWHPGPDLPVVARGNGRFEVAGMPMTFERGDDGDVVGFTLSAGRVRRIGFVRQ